MGKPANARLRKKPQLRCPSTVNLQRGAVLVAICGHGISSCRNNGARYQLTTGTEHPHRHCSAMQALQLPLWRLSGALLGIQAHRHCMACDHMSCTAIDAHYEIS